MEEAFRALLLPAAPRCYWGRAPQSVVDRPYIVMYRISGTPDVTMQGPSGYIASRVQVDCFGDTYTSTKVLARAVIAALSGYRGGMFQGIFVVGDRDMTLEGGDATDVADDPSQLFRTSIDVMIHHTA